MIMDKIILDLRSVAMVISAATLSLIIVRRISLDKLPASLANLAVPVLACGITGGLLMYGPADPTILFTVIMFYFLLDAKDILNGEKNGAENGQSEQKDWWKFWKGWGLCGGSGIPRKEENRVDDVYVKQTKDGWHFWRN